MRISTRDRGTRASQPARGPKPTARQRALFFVLGALLGGFLGYGLITSSPGPRLSFLDPRGAAWIVGPAVIVGGLAALSPSAFLRSRRKFWLDEEDDG